MGYEHRTLKAACAICKKQVLWSCKISNKIPRTWKCECGTRNYLTEPPKWPDLPLALYIGHKKNKRLKIHPIPPNIQNSDWAQPYSIRSFLYQASRSLGGCYYMCRERGTVMDQKIFADFCCSPESLENSWGDPDEWECHMANGWIHGYERCDLWDRVAQLCQTDSERRFLHQYLGYVKDRQFPMLIPQAWVGIADRRRPDFVAYIPLQFWNYKWIAIQLDAAHKEEQQEDDILRNNNIADHNYEVYSFKPIKGGYYEDVRILVEQIDKLMQIADKDSWSVAYEVKVNRYEEEIDDIPF